MNILTRRHCTACRLAKCLDVGMSPDLIRKEDLGGTKRKSTESHSQELVECQPVMVCRNYRNVIVAFVNVEHNRNKYCILKSLFN
jgi:hypothetical protein